MSGAVGGGFTDDGENIRRQGVGDGSVERAGEQDARAVPELVAVLGGDVEDLGLEVGGRLPVGPQLEYRRSDRADGVVDSLNVAAEAATLGGGVSDAGQPLQTIPTANSCWMTWSCMSPAIRSWSSPGSAMA